LKSLERKQQEVRVLTKAEQQELAYLEKEFGEEKSPLTPAEQQEMEALELSLMEEQGDDLGWGIVEDEPERTVSPAPEPKAVEAGNPIPEDEKLVESKLGAPKPKLYSPEAMSLLDQALAEEESYLNRGGETPVPEEPEPENTQLFDPDIGSKLLGTYKEPTAMRKLGEVGFVDALSRLEAGPKGFDSINEVPTGNYNGHTNARSYIEPALKAKYGTTSLTERTIEELIEIGTEWTQAKGSGKAGRKNPDGTVQMDASGAMGFGQITPTTMKMLVDKGVVKATDKYDKETQMKMVEWLFLNKQPSVRDYLKGKHDDLEKAVKGLGAEWDAFTKSSNKALAKQILKDYKEKGVD
jgi:hypothetical protein